MQLASIQDVLADQLADLKSAEQQLVQALPKMAQAASDDGLRKAFENHLEQTRGHVQRLDQIISDLHFPVPTEHCEGMEGLLKEGEHVLSMAGDPAAKDAA